MMKKYVVFLCRQCGAPVGARNSQKTAKCTRCGKINPVDHKKIRVIHQTDDMKEMQAAIQMIKLKRKSFPQKNKWRLKYER